MLNSLKGLLITLRTTLRRPVTAQYPKKHLPVQDRFMGFPALTWDEDVGEPYCVGCMVCIRECPTQCMSATMVDNPLFADKQSKRRKIVGTSRSTWGAASSAASAWTCATSRRS